MLLTSRLPQSKPPVKGVEVGAPITGVEVVAAVAAVVVAEVLMWLLQQVLPGQAVRRMAWLGTRGGERGTGGGGGGSRQQTAGSRQQSVLAAV